MRKKPNDGPLVPDADLDALTYVVATLQRIEDILVRALPAKKQVGLVREAIATAAADPKRPVQRDVFEKGDKVEHFVDTLADGSTTKGITVTWPGEPSAPRYPIGERVTVRGVIREYPGSFLGVPVDSDEVMVTGILNSADEDKDGLRVTLGRNVRLRDAAVVPPTPLVTTPTPQEQIAKIIRSGFSAVGPEDIADTLIHSGRIATNSRDPRNRLINLIATSTCDYTPDAIAAHLVEYGVKVAP